MSKLREWLGGLVRWNLTGIPVFVVVQVFMNLWMFVVDVNTAIWLAMFTASPITFSILNFIMKWGKKDGNSS